jgi:hypothetical protein
MRADHRSADDLHGHAAAATALNASISAQTVSV